MKLRKMTDYAVVCLGTLAKKSGHSMSATELSRETGLKLYTVQKLLKLLVSKSDFIRANRGPRGGYVLNKNDAEHTTENFSERLESMSNVSTDASNLERLNRWNSAIQLFKRKTHIGVGSGNICIRLCPIPRCQ